MNGKLDVKVEYMFDEEKQETEVSFVQYSGCFPHSSRSFQFYKERLGPTFGRRYESGGIR